jgi:four helix bundle protein
VGANYIEANEALSRKDFYLRIKIAKKEARETLYWLQHIEHDNKSPTQLQIDYLYKENQELINIFGSILKTQIQSVRKIGI